MHVSSNPFVFHHSSLTLLSHFKHALHLFMSNEEAHKTDMGNQISTDKALLVLTHQHFLFACLCSSIEDFAVVYQLCISKLFSYNESTWWKKDLAKTLSIELKIFHKKYFSPLTCFFNNSMIVED